ncbi:aminodeoxychorismate synthase component I [Peribacillus sp. SCS-37]|uniref:aminodeoxychorismate synthase component I n=1 Tax=Paraperibacillus esterisolvens TaxID=3115296 RepID=UPI003905A549
MMSVPYLLFEFTDGNGRKNPALFKDPIDIIETSREEEVLDKLRLVETYAAEGMYAAGYLAYEAAPAFDQAFIVKKGEGPLLWFGIFKSKLLPENDVALKPFEVSEWKAEMEQDEYQKGFQYIRQQIEEGNTYQVNFTMRLRAQFSGDDFAFYKRLSKAQNSNYSAYLNTGRRRILSASPELFFRQEGGEITARPMKGTAARGKTFLEDRQKSKWLYESEKNRAENLMIVDLLRNDLGAVAEAGSVRVPELFAIEKYPTVWQMTSEIKAGLKKGLGITDVMKALFPCGSITGAPKISTMGIIAETEQSARGIYCGAIGYIEPGGNAIFNVPIRTVAIDAESGEAEYGAGGGITWDSEMRDEYGEAYIKARLLTQNPQSFELLESLRLEDGEYVLRELHLKRIMESAAYFSYPADIEHIGGKLEAYAQSAPDGHFKVRCLLSSAGSVSVEGIPIGDSPDNVKIKLADGPVSSDNTFLYHKTTNRSVYNDFRAELKDEYDVLLWNERGELTEFTQGNLVIKMAGGLYTPAISSGLLAGTLRQSLIDEGRIEERILHKSVLKDADEIWFINSVRGWIKAEMALPLS